MPTVSVVTAVASVSSVFGLFSVLAYFFIGQKVQPTDSIVDVMGHRVDLELEIQLLAQFSSDDAKLAALRQRHHHNDAMARAILDKVQGNVDVHFGAKSRDRRYLIAAILFFGLAVLAAASPLFSHSGENAIEGATSGSVQASAVMPAAAPSQAAARPAPAPAPVFAERWESAQPGGTPYSQAFPQPTENRHGRSNAMASGTIRVSQLTAQPGLEKQITRAEYSCSGGGCPWSLHPQSNTPQGRHDGDYTVHPNKQSVIWRRVWDGDSVVETNTVYYDVFIRRCISNCP